MLQKLDRRYFSWTKHHGDLINLDRPNLVKYTDGKANVIAHPSLDAISLDLSQSIIEQVKKLEKSNQLYFFGLVWLDFVSFEHDRELIEKVLIELCSSSKPLQERMKHDMVWDDHALSERVSVLVSLLASSSEKKLSPELKSIIIKHIDTVTLTINEFIESNKWSNNNHRVFHLCARVAVASFYNKKQDIDIYVGLLEKTIKNLFQIESGLSVEQSISYYSFDLILLKYTLGFLDSIELSIPTLNYQDIFEKNKLSLSFLSFPDCELPASGDTPLGLKLRKRTALTKEQYIKIKSALAKLGHFRLGSESDFFNVHLITHNAESSHGHNSPLHIDIWNDALGYFIVDSGGPYLYGNQLRFDWFRNIKAHNCLNINGMDIGSISAEAHYQNENTIYGVAKSTHGCHQRTIKTTEHGLLIFEQVNSSCSWEINYQFSSSITVTKQGNNILCTKGNNSVLMKITPEFEFDIASGFRTFGRGSKEEGNVVKIKGHSGNHEINLLFLKM